MLRRAWDWVDDHLTKTLAVIGANVAIGDVMTHASEIKLVAGDLGLRLAIVAVFAALFWRGWVTGKRGKEMEAALNKPPDIP
jgi:hypothetical protein